MDSDRKIKIQSDTDRGKRRHRHPDRDRKRLIETDTFRWSQTDPVIQTPTHSHVSRKVKHERFPSHKTPNIFLSWLICSFFTKYSLVSL